jgi:lipoyl synthase
MHALENRIRAAGKLSRAHFGNAVVFYLPGMFSRDGVSGKYPAVSITGRRCDLNCDHCGGKLLATMIAADAPELLIERCLRLSEKGNYGVLISGGCDVEGRLPWRAFAPAIREIKRRTPLFVSVHSGLVDEAEARMLKDAGADQALIDVVGDDETYRTVYHVDFGVSRIVSAMKALAAAGLPIVPHIVCGLHHGRMQGEKKAVEMISEFRVQQVVIVSLMRIKGTAAAEAVLPPAEAVADLIAHVRLRIPEVLIGLGCARRRGESRTELLALEAGVNRMAIPSEEAVLHARRLGLTVRFQQTCCSVSRDLTMAAW